MPVDERDSPLTCPQVDCDGPLKRLFIPIVAIHKNEDMRDSLANIYARAPGDENLSDKEAWIKASKSLEKFDADLAAFKAGKTPNSQLSL